MLDLDVKSRVARAASRIAKRLETGLRDTRTAIQQKTLVPTIAACDLATTIYKDVAYDPLISYVCWREATSFFVSFFSFLSSDVHHLFRFPDSFATRTIFDF